MLNKIEFLIRKIKQQIPMPVLNYAFIPRRNDGSNTSALRQTMDWTIRSEIIDNWVLPDCNLTGGQEVTIDLAACRIRDNLIGGYLVEIPLEATGGRHITTVMSVGSLSGALSVSRTGNEIADAVMGPMAVSHARVQIVGPNIILMEGMIFSAMRSLLVRLENESSFNNIQEPALLNLSKLCVLAAKAYIYNQCIIDAEQSPIIHGVPFGVIKNIIDGYADSQSMYQEYLETDWYCTAIMQDRETHNKMLRMMLSRG